MVDLILLGVFAGFARAGWTSGFVRRLFGLVFIVASFVLAAYLRPVAGGLIEGSTMRGSGPRLRGSRR